MRVAVQRVRDEHSPREEVAPVGEESAHLVPADELARVAVELDLDGDQLATLRDPGGPLLPEPRLVPV